eukprot:9343284-Prorocentrum_lima.AAC.1
MTFGTASTTQLNASWNVVNLVGMVVEMCVQETGQKEFDWRVKLSIPRDSPNPEVQFQEFETLWKEIRPFVPLELTN